MRLFAISDIHGNAKTFKALVENHIKLKKTDKLFLLGDYVDRGPDSLGVIKYILQLQKQGYDVTALRGNHEDMLLDNVSRNRHRIPRNILYFIQKLPYYAIYGNYIFVHAGLNFLLPNPFESKTDMIWIRDWYRSIDYQWLGNKTIVHGHTPVSVYQIENATKNSYLQVVNIDNGCFLVSNQPDYGSLCAIELTERVLYFQKNLDMVETWKHKHILTGSFLR